MNWLNIKKLFIICLLLTFVSQSNAKLRIAVVELRAGVSRSQSQVDGLADMLITELNTSGQFVVIERTQVNKIFAELGFQQNNALTEAQKTKVCNRLKIDAMLLGTVNFNVTERNVVDYTVLNMESGEYSVDLRLVSSQTGEILSTAGRKKQSSESLHSFMQRLATQLVENLPQSQRLQEVKCLYNYLYVYPFDLGKFTSSPDIIISNFNRTSPYGYNDWRLPTQEELSMMTSNRADVALNSTIEYAHNRTFPSSREYAVRLVRTGVLVAQDAGYNAPYLESEVLNFGNVSVLEGKVTKKIRIYNPSSSAIFIQSVQSNVQYIRPTYPTSIINSGGQEYISVTLYVANKQGSNITQTLTVRLNNGEEIDFIVKARVN